MSFDINNNYKGTFYGKDRLGFTTPDVDASDWPRPFLPVSYPAPWLPIRRRDDAHPVGGGVVISTGQLVGLDKSGALIPAGTFCGAQAPELTGTRIAPPAHAGVGLSDIGVAGPYNGATDAVFTVKISTAAGTDKFEWKKDAGAFSGEISITGVAQALSDNVTVTFAATTGHTADDTWTISAKAAAGAKLGNYCLLVYGADDVGFSINPQTGARVAAAGEHVLLAAPSDATTGTLTLPNGSTATLVQGDIDFALVCDLIPGGYARALGYAVRNMWQYIGGVNQTAPVPAGGIKYSLDGMNPTGLYVHNYMHEMGNAIQTKFCVRVPWIGATPKTLAGYGTNDGLTGYSQTDFSRSFAHFTGVKADAIGSLFPGAAVVASRFQGAGDSGNYAPYDPTKNNADEIIGRVLGVEPIYPILDYANRVRTQFERGQEQVGPFKEPNAAIGLMGGSATRGIDYQINLATNGIFRIAKDLGNKTLREEYFTYVYVHVSC